MNETLYLYLSIWQTLLSKMIYIALKSYILSRMSWNGIKPMTLALLLLCLNVS